jgi:hypothetical protein
MGDSPQTGMRRLHYRSTADWLKQARVYAFHDTEEAGTKVRQAGRHRNLGQRSDCDGRKHAPLKKGEGALLHHTAIQTRRADYGAGMTAASNVGQPTAGGKLFDKKRDAKPTAESCAVAGTVTRQS